MTLDELKKLTDGELAKLAQDLAVQHEALKQLRHAVVLEIGAREASVRVEQILSTLSPQEREAIQHRAVDVPTLGVSGTTADQSA